MIGALIVLAFLLLIFSEAPLALGLARLLGGIARVLGAFSR